MTGRQLYAALLGTLVLLVLAPVRSQIMPRPRS